MPGELPNIVSGRVANVLNLRGPNFITDAACASSFAAINAAFEMLTEHHVDAVIAGGVDRNMGAGDLRQVLQDRRARAPPAAGPLATGADGFVMGEGQRRLPAQAPLRRRARRRHDLRRDPRRGRLQRRQGQGHHRPQSRRPDSRAADGPGRMPASTRPRPPWSKPTAPAPRSAMWSRSRAWPRSSAAPTRQHRPGFGQEQHRSSEGRRRRGRPAQGDHGLYHKKLLPPTLNAERPTPTSTLPTRPLRSTHELRDWEQPRMRPRRGRRQRLRLWRHQFSPGSGGTRARHVDAANAADCHAGVDVGNGNGGTAGQ